MRRCSEYAQAKRWRRVPKKLCENLDHLAVLPELMARELEILRREKTLLERELSLVRREARMTPGGSGAGDRAIDAGFNVRTISDMSEFRGECDNFDT